MAQIAQQDHLVIDCGTSFPILSDEVKGKLRKAYLRGTLNDVVLRAKLVNRNVTMKIIVHLEGKFPDGRTQIILFVYDLTSATIKQIDCGALQPEDYSDDVPYDGE